MLRYLRWGGAISLRASSMLPETTLSIGAAWQENAPPQRRYTVNIPVQPQYQAVLGVPQSSTVSPSSSDSPWRESHTSYNVSAAHATASSTYSRERPFACARLYADAAAAHAVEAPQIRKRPACGPFLEDFVGLHETLLVCFARNSPTVRPVTNPRRA